VKPKSKPPFSVKTFLATVAGGRTMSTYRKSETVFSQGDEADAVFYVQSGKVKLTVVSEQGKEAVIAIYGRGDFFGEGCLNSQPLRLASAATMTEAIIMRGRRVCGRW
jgi:CRP/FNR family transcriptional regulator, cyclic AMP receptor protein